MTYATHIERDEQGMLAQTVPNRSRECCACGAPYEPYHRRAGVQRFCSDPCRVWAYKHPGEARQRPLDFAGPAAPAIGTPAHEEQRAALAKRESKKAALLALLRRGPARTWDCMLAGGSGWRSRLQELREEGYRIHTEEHSDYAIYTLEETR